MEAITESEITESQLARLRMRSTNSAFAFTFLATSLVSPAYAIFETKAAVNHWLVEGVGQTQSTSAVLVSQVDDQAILQAMFRLFETLQATQRSLDADAETLLYKNLWGLYE